MAAAGRALLPAYGIRVDGESDAYVAERLRLALRRDQMPSEAMAEGISHAELEEICRGEKTTWSNGSEVTEAQRKAACAAMNA